MGCPSSFCRNLSAGGQLEQPSEVNSSISTGIRASDPWRGRGASANIESTTITETSGIFTVVAVLVSSSVDVQPGMKVTLSTSGSIQGLQLLSCFAGRQFHALSATRTWVTYSTMVQS